MRQPHQTCETCAYSARVSTVKAPEMAVTDSRMECRINPPVVIRLGDYPRTLWPEVSQVQWCGRWGPK